MAIGEFKKYNPKDLEHLHDIEIMILKDILKILNKNNIPYFIYAGSAIGAVRHGGFIPWDDDIDLAFFRDDYEKAVIALNRELDPNKYDVIAPNLIDDCFYTFAKVSLKGTKFSFWYKDYVSFNVGIHIDLFPFDNVPDSDFKGKIYNFKTRLINHLQTNAIIEIKDSKAHLLIHKALKLLPISNKKWKSILYNSLTKYNKKETKRVTEFLIQPSFIAFDREDLLLGETMKFEDVDVVMPKNYDKHLKEYFGNYMELPPEEDRYNNAPEILDFGKY